jgi:hypothetical protein
MTLDAPNGCQVKNQRHNLAVVHVTLLGKQHTLVSVTIDILVQSLGRHALRVHGHSLCKMKKKRVKNVKKQTNYNVRT